MRRRQLRLVRVVAVVAVVLLTGCTTTEPPPPTPTPSSSPTAAAPASVPDDGDRIAIVVGPDSDVSPGEAAALETAALQLAADPPDGIDEVRVARAESDRFAIDLVELFASEDYDVVCIVGSGAAPLLLEAARIERGLRLCGTDAAVEGGPATVVAVAIDPAALATLAGAATRTAVPPVGLVVGEEAGGLDVVEPLLTSTLPTPVAPSPSPTPPASPGPPAATPTPVPSPSPPAPPPPAVVASSAVDQPLPAAVEELVAVGPSTAVVLTPGSAEAVETLRAGGTRSVVVDDWTRLPGADQPPGVLVALTVDREAQLRAAITAARDPSSAQISLLRLADGVLGVEPGPAAGGLAASQRVEEVLDSTGS